MLSRNTSETNQHIIHTVHKLLNNLDMIENIIPPFFGVILIKSIHVANSTKITSISL